MRDHERRQLLEIEQHLLAETPALAELFAPLDEPRWSRRSRTVGRLAAVSALRWTVTDTDEHDRRRR